MPRQRKVDSTSEPKKRSRTGCWPCKARKIKCDEDKPQCQNCIKQGEQCDYSIRLNWTGRSKRTRDEIVFAITPSSPSTYAVTTHASPTGAKSTPQAVFSAYETPPVRTQRQEDVSQTSSDHRLNPPAVESQRHHLPSFAQFQSQITPGTAHQQNEGNNPPSHNHDTPCLDPELPHEASYGKSGMQLPRLISQDHSWLNGRGAKILKLASSEALRPFIASSSVAPRSTYGLENTPAVLGFSVHPQENGRSVIRADHSTAYEPDRRRKMSVSSLLSGPPGDETDRIRPGKYPKATNDGFVFYGFDFGYPDLDVPKNDDRNAITSQSSESSQSQSHVLKTLRHSFSTTSDAKSLPPVYKTGGYYSAPVEIRIPEELEPLPEYLTENPMNLIYFHHFLNHTARVLVPGKCDKNPLRINFPQSMTLNPIPSIRTALTSS